MATTAALARIHTARLYRQGARVLVVKASGPDAGTVLHVAANVADAHAWRQEWGIGMVAPDATLADLQEARS